MKRSEIFLGLLRIPVDFAAAVGALFVAYNIRANPNILPAFLKQPDIGNFPSISAYTQISVFGALAFIVIIGFFGLYSLRTSDRFSAEVRKIFAASLIWLTCVITYYFAIREFPFSRLVLFYGAFFIFIFSSFGRLLMRGLQRALLRIGIGKRRIVFVGANMITEELSYVFNENFTADICAILKNADELSKFLEGNPGIDEIIQTQDDHEQSTQIIAMCREKHLGYHFVPDLLEVYRTNIQISPVGGIPLISLNPTPLDGWGRVLKRTFDVVVSTFFLILLSPFFIVIAIKIKKDSPGTIFFRYLDDGMIAKRVGQFGALFHCLKFRTMKMGTHSLRYTDLALYNTRKGSPLVKIKKDPRVTDFGQFLRRFSIDELPQLWNVFKGDMSLVGPRPHLPEEVANYKSHHKFVLTVKPGITGLAQISGRSDLPFEEEMRLDTYYVENWSLFKDLKILLKTALVVLKPHKE